MHACVALGEVTGLRSAIAEDLCHLGMNNGQHNN